jgi:hypothetical protein
LGLCLTPIKALCLGLLAGLGFWLPQKIQAQPQTELTLHEIVDRANKTLRGDSSHGTLSMTIVTPKWTRNVEIEGWNRDRQMAFIKILAPAKDRGSVTLRRKNEMWLWLPKVERVIKIPPTMMHNAWQGSDFTYEDIVKADSIVKDYEHRLLDKSREGERMVYKIEALPKPEAPVVWGKVLMWVAVYGGEEVVPLKEEDYSERGDLIRTIFLSDIRRVSGRRLPMRLECLPAKKPGQKTVLEYHSLEFDLPLSDEFFSYSRLQKGGA